MSKKSSNLRAAVIGVRMGANHVKNFQAADGCEVVAACDLEPELLKKVAEEHNVPQTYAKVEKMLAEEKLDIVSVATPNTLHHPMTTAALEQGLHVLCEKPLAMNARQAEEMVETAKRNKVKLGVHFNHRMRDDVQAIARAIQAGELGDVYFARTVWHRRKGIPLRPSFLKMDSSGGGALIDLGVHILDIACYCLGFPKLVAVNGQACTKFAARDAPGLDMDVDDFATAYCRFENGATLALEVSWASHHEHPEQMLLHVYGDEGGATRRVHDYQDISIELHKRHHGNLVTTRVDRFTASSTTVQQDFVNAIREDRAPACSGEHGLLAMKIIDGIYESSRTGREVRFD